MRYARRTALAAAAAIGLSLVAMPTAPADTENCVSHAEVDNYVDGLTRTQVWNRFDIYGDAAGELPSGDGYKADYVPTCWAPNSRKVVVAFSYVTGESLWIDVRDL